MFKQATAYTGQCLCGEIQYQVDAIEPQMGHCHCSMCRKFHGAAFATFGEAQAQHFRWTAGEHLLQSYVADNGTTRQFCRQCGSSLIFKPADDQGELVEFSLGTLDLPADTPLALKPDAHIFVGSKPSWSMIHDALPQFEGDRRSQRLDKC